MQLIVKLEQDDIVTREIGYNIAIEAKGITVIFDSKAAEKFCRDAREIINRSKAISRGDACVPLIPPVVEQSGD